MTLEEKKEKTAKLLAMAQKNGSPTYWSYVTGKLETTPGVNHLRNAKKNL